MVFLPIWQLNYIGYNAIKKWLSSKNCRYLKCEIQSIVAELNNRLIDWIFNDTLCKNAMSSGKVRFASCNFYICKKNICLWQCFCKRQITWNLFEIFFWYWLSTRKFFHMTLLPLIDER